MAYYQDFANTPAGEVLKAIQMRGKASIKELATDLGVTRSAIRQHLIRLQRLLVKSVTGEMWTGIISASRLIQTRKF